MYGFTSEVKETIMHEFEHNPIFVAIAGISKTEDGKFPLRRIDGAYYVPVPDLSTPQQITEFMNGSGQGCNLMDLYDTWAGLMERGYVIPDPDQPESLLMRVL